MVQFYSTKTYTHSEGFSCAFRQWRATSHCNLIHGYALQVKFVFSGSSLDDRNWIVDFGDLKEIKSWLKSMFDHTCCVAADDPHLTTFQDLHEKQLIDIRIVDKCGCEGFCEMIYNYVSPLINNATSGRCWVESVEVSEHTGNSAIIKNQKFVA